MRTTKQISQIVNNKVIFLLFILLLFLGFRNTIITKHAYRNFGFVFANQIPFPYASTEQIDAKTLNAEYFLINSLSNANRDQSLFHALGFVLLSQNRPQEASHYWEKVSYPPTNNFVLRGDQARYANQLNEALEIYYEALNFEPSLAAAWYGIGVIEKNNNRTIDAINAFQHAWNLGHPNSTHQLASLLRDNQNFEESISIWQQALANYPTHPHRQRWWQGLSNTLHSTKQWEIGVQTTEQALQEFPDDPQLYAELGYMLYKATGDLNTAYETLQYANKLSDDPSYSHSLIGNMMSQEQRYHEAYFWYDSALKFQPNKLSWKIARAHAARASGDLTTAQFEFEEIIKQHPESAIAYYGLSLTLQQQGNLKRSADMVWQALNYDSNPGIANYLNAGEIFEQNSDYKNALWAYQQVLIIEPQEPTAIIKTEYILKNIEDKE